MPSAQGLQPAFSALRVLIKDLRGTARSPDVRRT